jgi:hypothetical protein
MSTKSQQLAELILSMDLVTEKGIRARHLARDVLATEGDLLTAMRLVQHATSPAQEDGAYHENAFDLSSMALELANRGLTP